LWEITDSVSESTFSTAWQQGHSTSISLAIRPV
jgi:hypothetical protein